MGGTDLNDYAVTSESAPWPAFHRRDATCEQPSVRTKIERLILTCQATGVTYLRFVLRHRDGSAGQDSGQGAGRQFPREVAQASTQGCAAFVRGNRQRGRGMQRTRIQFTHDLL